MTYRNDGPGVAAVLEEQRELLSLEFQSRRRRRRAALGITLVLGALVSAGIALASGPPPKKYACHNVEIVYEPYDHPTFGRIGRPPDTWTTCAWSR